MYTLITILLTLLPIIPLASAQTTPTPTPTAGTATLEIDLLPIGTSFPSTLTNYASQSAAISRISTYQTHLSAQSQFSSVMSVFYASLIADDMVQPGPVDSTGGNGVSGYTGGPWTTTIIGLPTTASWYSGLPTDVKGYLQSMASAESQLITGNGAARATGVVGMGMGVAGVLGAVLVL